MSVKSFCPQRRQKERKPLPDAVAGEQKPEKEEDKEQEICYLRQSSHCPSCNREYDIALILPCSHTLCGRCVEAGEATKSGHSQSRGASLPVCAVLCPRCRHLVELPCLEWSSATTCLPRDPTLIPALGTDEKYSKDGDGASEDPLQHLQSNTYCRDAGEVTAQGYLYGSTAASPPVAPVDGAIDLREEEMERSILGLSFALDPSSVPPSLHLSNSFLTVTCRGESPSGSLSEHHGNKVRSSVTTSDPPVTLTAPKVCADVVITRGQYYWEVDVCNSSVYWVGVTSLDGSVGWWLQRRGLSFCAVYDGSQEPLCTVPPQIKTIGVFLNIGGGALSFHNPVNQEHLATLPTHFSPIGVLPALGLGQGRLKLRSGLPPPPHVFLSRTSSYRGPSGAGRGRWHRDIPFQSVRTVIQKFEELSASDSDSGLVSSFGSSCSTLASLPDPAPGPLFHSGQAGQEAEAE